MPNLTHDDFDVLLANRRYLRGHRMPGEQVPPGTQISPSKHQLELRRLREELEEQRLLRQSTAEVWEE